MVTIHCPACDRAILVDDILLAQLKSLYCPVCKRGFSLYVDEPVVFHENYKSCSTLKDVEKQEEAEKSTVENDDDTPSIEQVMALLL